MMYMRKDEILATMQVEKKKNNKVSDYRFYDDPKSRVLAKAVEHCLLEEKVASFKKIDEMTELVKQNFNNVCISVYGKVVIFNSVGDIVIQFSENNKKDPSIINTTEVFINEDESVRGLSKSYTMVKVTNPVTSLEKGYTEEELSRCELDSRDEISVSDMSADEVALYKKMVICSSLMKPIMQRLNREKYAEEVSQQLSSMFNESEKRTQEDLKKVSM